MLGIDPLDDIGKYSVHALLSKVKFIRVAREAESYNDSTSKRRKRHSLWDKLDQRIAIFSCVKASLTAIARSLRICNASSRRSVHACSSSAIESGVNLTTAARGGGSAITE